MRSSMKGYYTVEAAMLLPLVLLMILALGYITKAEGNWENAFHCAMDESIRTSSMACDGVSAYTAVYRIPRRIRADVEGLSDVNIRGFRSGFADGTADELTAYTLQATDRLRLPADLGHLFRFSADVKYRAFVGTRSEGEPLGTEGLEEGLPEDPVWIFPLSGEKYHTKTCTYVRACVHSMILNAAVRSQFKPCSSCRSDELPAGSIVYCFEGTDTAYHRGTCRTIHRHTMVIDRTEAIDKGYTPCSKCGGN